MLIFGMNGVLDVFKFGNDILFGGMWKHVCPNGTAWELDFFVAAGCAAELGGALATWKLLHYLRPEKGPRRESRGRDRRGRDL